MTDQQEREQRPSTPRERAEYFRDRAQKIAASFNAIKANPLNLNLVMAHIGVLSLTLDEVLHEMAEIVEQGDNNE